MAINISISKHHVCFPSKILSGQVGRTLNMVLSADTDNGTVVGKGDYVSFDQYETATAPNDFEGTILEQAADGNWYVEVTKIDPNDPAILICETEIIAENYDTRFTDLANFYNKSGKTVRGYVLGITDVYELSPDAFTGTPQAGKTVTISGQKHVVDSE